jgi:hypothetical protein
MSAHDGSALSRRRLITAAAAGLGAVSACPALANGWRRPSRTGYEGPRG